METKKTSRRYAKISSITNEENGEITLYIENEEWGPVVTGKNLAEAKAKMNEAFGLAMLANTFCDPRNNGSEYERMKEYKEEAEKVSRTLELSY